ncbi:IGSF1 protein, partial [Todus mexicanus]|nr:IGSF1 protein [Todus mexicanus]
EDLDSLDLRGSRAQFFISNATQEDTNAYSCHYLSGHTVLACSETLGVMVQAFNLPIPVLSILPGQEVAAGAYVILPCTVTHSSIGCFLYLEDQVKTLNLLSKQQDDFNVSSVPEGNRGHYSCQCFTKGALFEWSAVSKTLDLVVR